MTLKSDIHISKFSFCVGVNHSHIQEVRTCVRLW